MLETIECQYSGSFYCHLTCSRSNLDFVFQQSQPRYVVTPRYIKSSQDAWSPDHLPLIDPFGASLPSSVKPTLERSCLHLCTYARMHACTLCLFECRYVFLCTVRLFVGTACYTSGMLQLCGRVQFHTNSRFVCHQSISRFHSFAPPSFAARCAVCVLPLCLRAATHRPSAEISKRHGAGSQRFLVALLCFRFCFNSFPAPSSS